jgi:hypothetical protein
MFANLFDEVLLVLIEPRRIGIKGCMHSNASLVVSRGLGYTNFISSKPPHLIPAPRHFLRDVPFRPSDR